MTNYQLPVTNNPLDWYQMIPRVLCFVTEGEDVLLIQGAPDKKLWAGKFNGLGGHVERGESPHAAARREIQEEAGLAVTDLRLRGVIAIDVAHAPGIGLFVFSARAASRQVTASAEGALAWVPLRRVSGLETVEDLPRLLPLVFGQPPEAPPFGARYYYDAGGRLRIELFSDQTGTDVPLAGG
jgi:8-oxo-dGTP diphosphatase